MTLILAPTGEASPDDRWMGRNARRCPWMRLGAARKTAPVVARTSADNETSSAFRFEPETNGCAEKAIQVLKEQVLWTERFDTLDEPRRSWAHATA
jgi:hypothetical protein